VNHHHPITKWLSSSKQSRFRILLKAGEGGKGRSTRTLKGKISLSITFRLEADEIRDGAQLMASVGKEKGKRKKGVVQQGKEGKSRVLRGHWQRERWSTLDQQLI